jgi:hypothetical protein
MTSLLQTRWSRTSAEAVAMASVYSEQGCQKRGFEQLPAANLHIDPSPPGH